MSRRPRSRSVRFVALFSASALMLAACGDGGSGRKSLRDHDDGDSDGTSPFTTSQSGSGETGSGAGNSAVSASVTSASTTGAGGAGGSSTATTVTTGSGGASPCDYPEGPYDTSEGSVLPPSLSWVGYAENDASPSTVLLSDFLDCDGSKGIDALLIQTCAGWAGECVASAATMNQKKASWSAAHIHVLTLLIEDEGGSPATAADAKAWSDAYSLGWTGVVADPTFSLVPDQSSVGIPLDLVVDPRTMTVVYVQEGFSGDWPELEALAAQN